MLEIISERHPVTRVDYSHDFSRIGDPGAGYSFPCDQDGNITFACDAARENYEYAVSHPEKIRDDGIIKKKYTYTEPAKGKCKCGSIVLVENQYLGAFACGNCGQWYNLSGQELLDPDYWQEDY